MNTITQDMKFKQALIQYSLKHGVTNHHPNQHTRDELKLISDMRRRNPNAGLVVFWVKLMQHCH